MDDHTIKKIRSLFLFELLTLQELEEIVNISSEKTCTTGDRLFSEKDEGDSMFVIISGTVKIVKEENGGEKEIITLRNGDFFGEISLFERVPRTAGAVILEDTSLLEIHRDEFGELISRMPHLGIKIFYRIIQEMGKRLQRMNIQSDNLFI